MDWVVLLFFLFVIISLYLISYWLSIRFFVPVFSHFERVSTLLFTTILTLNMLFSVFLICLIILIYGLTIDSAWAMLSIVLMTLLAFGDSVKGRIPVWLVGVSLVIGIVFGVLRSQLFANLLGGIVNFGVGLLIYLGGSAYRKMRGKAQSQKPYFGFGDVYGAGVLGFLLGFPNGLVALSFSFPLAVVLAVFEAGIQKTKFLQIRIRLGLCYFLSALAMIFSSLMGSVH